MKIGPRIQRIGSLAALAFCTLAAAAQTQSKVQASKAQITQAIDPAQRKILGNSVHPLASSAGDQGRAESGMQMKDMLLLLHPSDAQAAALKKYIDNLHNPNSANFHNWLTPEQFAAQYGAADADVKTVSDWLAANGFAVEQVGRGKNWIRFSGTSSQVETAFKTTIHKYSVNGATKYANATALSIPAALAPAVSGIVSANNFLSHPQHLPPTTIARDKSGKLQRVADASAAVQLNTAGSPAFTSAGDQEENYLAPADFAKIYNTQPLVSAGNDGGGVSIAIVGRSDIELSDIEAFRTIAGLPFNDPNVIYATTDPGDVADDDVEGTLDVEWSGAVAPGAKINYVIGASTTTTDGVDIAASYIVDNVTSPIMSLSFGLCEENVSDTEIAFYQTLWQQAAAEGITVLVAAGDGGSSECNNPVNQSTTSGFGVNGLASSAYDVAVGGTEFNDPDQNTYWSTTNGSGQLSAKGYIPEAVWNESCSASLAPSSTNCLFPPYEIGTYAGGGGASSCISRTEDEFGDVSCTGGYPKPSWQTAPGVPTDGVRDLPDVSLASASEHDGYLFCFQGACQWTTNSDGSISLLQGAIIGGTSAATPSMAGILALVEQKAGQFQGVANYQLYKIASAQSAANCDSSQQTDPTQTSSCVFNDITAGSNAVPCASGSPNCSTAVATNASGAKPAIVLPPPRAADVTNGYSAVAGYDLASGLGSVNAANLVNAWGTNSTLPSTTSLTVSQTKFQHGTPITVTAQVAPASGTGTPSGDVLLKASTVGSLQSGPLTGGSFSESTINLPGGTYDLTAQYSGDATYGSSTSQAVSVTVTPEDSVATGASFAISRFIVLGQQQILQLSSTQLGGPFWLQVQINGVSGSTGATGTVELLNGSTSLGSYPLDKTGKIYVQCGPGTPCDLGVGNYTFTAKYSGDASFNPSTTTIPFSITQGLIDWEVLVNNQQPPAGGQVIASVYFNNDPTVIPTGTVTLTRSDTNAVLGTGTIDKTGVATIPFNAPAGTYFVNGSYAGDQNYIAGFQEISEEIITSTSGSTGATVSLNLSGGAVSLGQHSQYTVSVSPTQTNSRVPIGTVTLFSGGGQIAAAIELSGGKATGYVEWDQVGPQSVYAVYSGSTTYAGGSSPSVAVTVAQAQPTVNVLPLATVVAAGTQASITATLTSPLASTNVQAPTGTIQFFDAVNGATPQAIGTPQGIATGNGGSLLATIAPVLAQGSHVISAIYSGDANWKTTTGTAAAPIVSTTPGFTATPASSSLTVSAGETASVIINTQSVLGFSAPIAVSCGGTLPVGVSCNSVTAEPGAAATLSLATTAPGETTSTAASAHRNSLLAFSGTVAFAGVFLICIPNRRRFYNLSVMLLALAIGTALAGCGGSSAKPTTMAISSSGTKAASGSTVTLTATIQSSNNVKGTVTFYDGSTAIGSAVTPVDGVATVTTSTLSVGTHAITAKFAGDSDNLPSASSDTLEQTITGSFTLTVNATSGALSQTISIPATLQ